MTPRTPDEIAKDFGWSSIDELLDWLINGGSGFNQIGNASAMQAAWKIIKQLMNPNEVIE